MFLPYFNPSPSIDLYSLVLVPDDGRVFVSINPLLSASWLNLTALHGIANCLSNVVALNVTRLDPDVIVGFVPASTRTALSKAVF